jgi:ABC-type Fe3+/spermidine/putrescine transport system ATPase subunit
LKPDRDALASGEETAQGESVEERGTVVLDNVRKVYPGTIEPAVSEVSLSIRSGEFFSLLGPSGSGKTTTLRLIAGFEQPTEGKIHIAGKEVSGLPPFKRPVHTVFQNYALFPHMTVERNVAYPLRMRRLDKKVITEQVGGVLERVSMSDYAKRLPHQLSGGQRQRVALARALVGQPEVVLLDEPLGALDLKLRQEMQLVLKHLQREVGITFIYVTHDQGEALAMSDRIAILSNGHINQVANPFDVYFKPATAFVARFVGKTNLLRCRSIGNGQVTHKSLTLKVAGAPASGDCVLSIRPESMKLGAAAENCANSVRGFVEEGIFQGTDVELRVRVSDVTFLVRSLVDQRVAIGEAVVIGWDLEAGVLVDDDGESLKVESAE